MKAKILAVRKEEKSTCYLCSISLGDYVDNLPKSYQDYDIQRQIVKNVYLDTLVDTVLGKKHIPPIVLVLEPKKFKAEKSFLDISEFKILDGLQRTFRLKAIKDTIDYCFENLDGDERYLEWSKYKFSHAFSKDLEELNSNTTVLRTVYSAWDQEGDDFLTDSFRDNDQWFEIWTGLKPDQEVRKMLTLNAGHKPVSTRHQIELLFLNLLAKFKTGKGKDFVIKRDKEISSYHYSKSRDCGTFHFAHVITSLLSLLDAKPVTTTTGLIQNIQSGKNGIEEYMSKLNTKFLKQFVSFLVTVDKALADEFPETGLQWMGREVSLAGLFGGIGFYAREESISNEKALSKFERMVKSKPELLNLDEFETTRNNKLDLSKINFGMVNRKAVFSATKKLLSATRPKKVDWVLELGAKK